MASKLERDLREIWLRLDPSLEPPKSADQVINEKNMLGNARKTQDHFTANQSLLILF